MSSRFRELARAAAVAVATCALSALSIGAKPDEPGGGALRVCADPNNLPFSNVAEQGFENEIAAILAAELGWRLEYTWWAQRRGFFRNTLRAGRCDVVMGVPVGTERAQITQPYYRSSFVFVQPHAARPVRSFDDPALRALKVGVQLIGDDAAPTPPGYALSRRNIVTNVVGFMIAADYASSDPGQPIVRAVERGDIDVAVVWGPLAGYYARRAAPALDVRPVSPLRDGGLDMSFDIGLGVRHGDDRLQGVLDRALRRRRREIDRVLDRFGVPRITKALDAR
jgi:mxaJ protein